MEEGKGERYLASGLQYGNALLEVHHQEEEEVAVNGTPFHSYGVSLAIWDHTVLPVPATSKHTPP